MIVIEQLDQTQNEVQAIVDADCFGSCHPSQCYTAIVDLVAREAGIDVVDNKPFFFHLYPYERDVGYSVDSTRHSGWSVDFVNEFTLSIHMGQTSPKITRGRRVWVRLWRKGKR